MSESVYPVPAEWARRARVDAAGYEKLHGRSLADPGSFWLEQARRLDWIKRPELAGDWSFDEKDFHIRWFADGKLNVSANCLDRHLASRRRRRSRIIWEPDEPGEAPRRFTYRQLHEEVCRFANVLKGEGVEEGRPRHDLHADDPRGGVRDARLRADRRDPFGGVRRLLARGAGGADRRIATATVFITADEGRRGGKRVPLKANVDAAAKHAPALETVIVVKATGGDVAMQPGRDVWYHEAAAERPRRLPARADGRRGSAVHPLHLGIDRQAQGRAPHLRRLSACGRAYTHELVFDYRPGTIYWCAADIGWVTGHSYIVYGPLANGATTLMFEGVPNWPDASRDLAGGRPPPGRDPLHRADRAARADARGRRVRHARPRARASSCSARSASRSTPRRGAGITRWSARAAARSSTPGGRPRPAARMITPLPGATAAQAGHRRPGRCRASTRSSSMPRGKCSTARPRAISCIARSWPGQMRTVWGDHDALLPDLFHHLSGQVFHRRRLPPRRGRLLLDHRPGRRRDQRLGPPHGHRRGRERAGAPPQGRRGRGGRHAARHQGPGHLRLCDAQFGGRGARTRCATSCASGCAPRSAPIATPDAIQFAPGLPKTRSGKIMRRILRKIAEGDVSSLGDTSTLADPAVVDDLVANRVG